MAIELKGISKHYPSAGQNLAVVSDLTVEIASGEFFVLLGPSGSGKSTVLRAIAGLTDIDAGQIALHGRDVTQLPARDRGVGLVFQNYALFRHMSVAENVEFGLRVRGVNRATRRKRRDELLGLVALENFADRRTSQLSGGQQQRVAVARALAHEPAVLLLDEPFAALDAKIRVELRDTVRRVQRSLGMTTILVTHDQEEAFALGDRIGVMDHGRLIEVGRPEGLYRHPACSFVAKFLGSANLLRAELARDALHLGSASLPPGEHTRAAGVAPGPVVALLRPEDIEIVDAHERLLSSRAFAAGTVETVTFAGSQQRVRVALANTNARVEITRASADEAVRPLPHGRRVLLGVRRVHVLPDDGSVDAEAESEPEPEAALRLRALRGVAA